ncbi:MAG: UDP-N-acetylglucosamine 2-epimerase (hydrolyzing) [Hymenobacteraceae bacterium]|nr:UDP-N-acetylglucosamine 2-epimerase (hydrolyzing) [Hymenobacteraceae bacterium]
MRIGVLTSSRADYGIYRPLLQALQADGGFDVRLFVFGTHLSPYHGLTVRQIEADNLAPIVERIESLVLADSPEAIGVAMGLTTMRFSAVWARWAAELDLVLALGDRYEMFAAVAAGVPFGLRVAHLHGGETTLGAIDNVFRHSLTLMARIHFASTARHAARVAELVGATAAIFDVGALSLSNLLTVPLLTTEEFRGRFGVDMARPTVLVTFHPETVAFERNREYIRELVAALEAIPEQVLITMPDADTLGSVIRAALEAFVGRAGGRAVAVESLGTQGYFSAMRHCTYLIGNTSSGIIEAASLGRYVLDLGDRQAGRDAGPNVLHCPVECAAILAAATDVRSRGSYTGSNLYGDGSTAARIVEHLHSLRLHD